MTSAATAVRPTDSHDEWDRIARNAVRDLHQASIPIFWADFLVSAGLAWTMLGVASLQPVVSAGFAAAFLVCVLALYRALCFMHELTHLRPNALPGFETAWNLLTGVPALMPSLIYTMGVHQSHHRLATYGTEQDPEYMPFAKSHWMTAAFVVQSVFIPFVLLVRFLLLAPVSLVCPPLRRVLAERASALTMHGKYRRDAAPELLRSMTVWESAITGVWGAAILLAVRGVLPWRLFAVWYGAMAVTALVNILRTLGAHHYESEGDPLDRTGQLLDSVDTPGAWWTELWAPVGLRYHALHHYFPGIPYHNLPEAHRRLVAALPSDAAYTRTLSPGLWHTLRRLWQTGWKRAHGPI
jgi:fatty acid desaturase